MPTVRDGFWASSIEALARQVRDRSVTAGELVEQALATIEAADPVINAFVAVDADGARRQAADIDDRIRRGAAVGPLAGIPIGVKDLEDATGFVTSFGSAFRAGDPPATRDSVLVARLRNAGAVVVGKTNTPEYGHKGTTDNPVFGATANPWNLAYSSGGSSGGSAAAVAAGMVPLATGSDGGGSIRLPGSLCGLSAFKASPGRVPVADGRPPGVGLLSVVGPMARRARDTAFVLDAVVGPHAADPFALPAPAGSWRAALDGRPPASVVWSPTLGYGVTDPEVLDACERTLVRLAAAGTRVVRLDDVFDTDPIHPWLALWVVARYRAQGHLIDTDDWDRLSPSIQPQIRAGAKATAVDVAAAIDAVYRLAIRLEEVLGTHAPLLLCPTIAGHPPLVGEELGDVAGEATAAWVKYTPFANLSRNPAGSVCVGRSSRGIPIGLQIVGRQLDDVGVLQAMAAVEDLVAFDDTPPV